eukprot:CAMPEP_0198145806 /NCGR_PEP_ID=MMETSP1443-20131203/25459_1 /TAXON_ID=186043 /ORGANISM="Entomoneis sp., Strain CCMP2396" /LENGTH=312 /DNA_ID=CAMNT_0043809537 /DNA_START=303 /DNA_END=1241 /DNA_ORIENTATION=+
MKKISSGSDLSEQVDQDDDQYYRPLSRRLPGVQTYLVKGGDSIYYKGEASFDGAPIVVERFKLVFFSIPKVACTQWKQLFRRMENFSDWHVQGGPNELPHNPESNGLTYLYHYNTTYASHIMTSPDWTRAMMVRDPKERFLSAFLDKALSNDHSYIKNVCCRNDPDVDLCVQMASWNLTGFFNLIQHKCDDDHWKPQDEKLDSKYWAYMDWIGHVESAERDAENLLTKIGAWEDYGATGWGPTGTNHIFQEQGPHNHYTNAANKMWTWYTPEIETMVEGYYRADYENPLFRFKSGVCVTCGNNIKNKKKRQG